MATTLLSGYHILNLVGIPWLIIPNMKITYGIFARVILTVWFYLQFLDEYPIKLYLWQRIVIRLWCIRVNKPLRKEKRWREWWEWEGKCPIVPHAILSGKRVPVRQCSRLRSIRMVADIWWVWTKSVLEELRMMRFS